MNKKLFLYFVLLVSIPAFATRQSGDTLVYKNKVMKLLTGWGYPSPLQTYYFQNKISYPFERLSTGNYRGHIANWKISNDSLFLTKVCIEENNYSLKNINEKATNKIHAKWFSGVIHCRYYNKNEKLKASYLFLVEKGHVKKVQKVKRYSRVNSSKLGLIRNDYIAFYYRLRNDIIYLNNKPGLLITNHTRLSPIFQYYNNSIFEWPYNWNNRSINGAPHCEWVIENKKLYLKTFELYSGLRYDSIYVQHMRLQEIAEPENNNLVFARGVSGIFKMVHGETPARNDISGRFHFKAEAITYFIVENGIVTETYTLDKDFDTDHIDENNYPNLSKLIQDYNRFEW